VSIPTAWLDQLRDRVSLSSLVMKSVPLKKAGSEWKACCPFHSEKGPSFFVNDPKGFYHCFGCGAHGDAIRWMTDHEGMTFIDAVKELAAGVGMEVPAPDPRAAAREKAREGHHDVLLRVSQLFQRELAAARPAIDYLEGRGIGPGVAAHFEIGFAPKVGYDARPFVLNVDAPVEALVELGVLRRNPDDGRVRDFFRARVIIPIHDARGRVVGFGGRILGPGEPKYLNSPDTPVFDKGRSLFNLHRASPVARAKDRLVIVEGYMDVIGLYHAGVTEVVAPNGTALTEAQMGLAWKLVDHPTVCLDGDKAGRAAALRTAMRALPILAPGKGLKFAFPPAGHDPDDVARQGGAEAVAAMLDETVSLADIIWSECITRMKAGPDAIAAVRRDVRVMVDGIKDPDVRASYTTAFGNRFASYGQRSSSARRSAPARRNVNQAVEDALFKGIIRHVDRINDLAELVGCRPWADDDISDILNVLIYPEGEPITRGNMVQVFERRGMGEKYRQAIARDGLRFPFLVGPPTDATFKALSEALRT